MDRGVAGCMAVPSRREARRGRVRAVFARSVHAATGEGCLTLGDASLPAHPYSILWPGFPQGWTVGQEVVVTAEGVFRQGARLVSLAGLERFTPSRACRPMADRGSIVAALAASQDRAAAIATKGGFHELFLQGLRSAPPDTTSRLSESFASPARRLGTALARLLRLRRWEGFARAACALAGAGLGLTPAGDDFLAGVMAALRYHGQSLGRNIVSQTYLDALAARLAGRTSPFSGFLLRGAAGGLVARPCSDWLWAVHGGNAAASAACVTEMAALGHSSGLDTFSGLLLTLQILMGERPWTHP